MPIQVGRELPPTPPFSVTEEHVRAFAAATGTPYDGGAAPATYPIVVAFEAMLGFLAAEQVELRRIVHGDQTFAFERPIVPGDTLSATLTVASVRTIGGNDIVGTRSEIRDAAGELVVTGTATLVHRGEA